MRPSKRAGVAIASAAVVAALATPGSAIAAANDNASCVGQGASGVAGGPWKGAFISNAARNGGVYFGEFIRRIAHQEC